MFLPVGLYRHAVPEQFVNCLVVLVEAAAGMVGLGADFVNGLADVRQGVAGAVQVVREHAFLDVGVAVTVGPVPAVAIVEFVAE